MNKGQQMADDIYIPLPGVLVLSINISYSPPIINIIIYLRYFIVQLKLVKWELAKNIY